MKKLLVFLFVLVLILPVETFAAISGQSPGCVSVSGTNGTFESDSKTQIESPYDGLLTDGDYITTVNVSGTLPSGASIEVGVLGPDGKVYTDPISIPMPTGISDLSAKVGLDPKYVGNAFLELNNPTANQAYVQIDSVQTAQGAVQTSTCSGSSSGSGGGSSGSGGSTTTCDLCKCLSDVQSSIGDLGGKLDGIKSDLDGVLSQITPTSSPDVPSPPSFGGVLDQNMPNFPYSTYSDTGTYFTDQGDAQTPGPLPLAPDPSNNWSGIQKQPQQDPDPILKPSPVKTSDPVLKQKPVGSAAPVLKQSPVGSSAPVLKQSPVGAAAPVLNQSPVGSAAPVLTPAPVLQSDGSLTPDPVDTSPPDWKQ